MNPQDQPVSEETLSIIQSLVASAKVDQAEAAVEEGDLMRYLAGCMIEPEEVLLLEQLTRSPELRHKLSDLTAFMSAGTVQDWSAPLEDALAVAARVYSRIADYFVIHDYREALQRANEESIAALAALRSFGESLSAPVRPGVWATVRDGDASILEPDQAGGYWLVGQASDVHLHEPAGSTLRLAVTKDGHDFPALGEALGVPSGLQVAASTAPRAPGRLRLTTLPESEVDYWLLSPPMVADGRIRVALASQAISQLSPSPGLALRVGSVWVRLADARLEGAELAADLKGAEDGEFPLISVLRLLV